MEFGNMRTVKILLAIVIVITGCSSVFSGEQDITVYDEDAGQIGVAAVDYPGKGIAAMLEGVVVVRVTLGNHGDVEAATAVVGPSPLIPSCLASAKNSNFRPNPQKRAFIIFEFRRGDGPCPEGTYSLFRPPNIVEMIECIPIARY
jgi:hypothetical protein